MSDPQSTPTRSDHAAPDRLLARAVLARALKRWLCRPAAPGAGAGWPEEAGAALEHASRVLDGGAAGPVSQALRGLRDHESTDHAERLAEYDRTYGHSLRGRVCPYETEYGRLAVWQQAHELSDLAGLYAAFGLVVGAKERADHIACEVEFLEWLSLKEAWARERGDHEQAAIAHDATRSFVRDHLGRFGPAFARSLLSESPPGFQRQVGALLAAVLERECAALGVPAGSPLLEVRPVEEDPVPMACGTGDSEASAGAGLVALGGRRARS